MQDFNLNISLLERISENSPGMIYRCRFEPNWPLLFVSKGSFNLIGYHSEELMHGQVDFANLIHPDDQDWVWEHFTINLDKGKECNLEYRIITKTGELKWVHEIANGTYNHNGDLVYIQGYVRDITDKKDNQRIIASLETHLYLTDDKERRLSTLFNAIPDIQLRVSKSGGCYFYNFEDDSLAGTYNNPGKQIHDFFPSQIATAFLKQTQKAIISGRSLTYNYQLPGYPTEKKFEARFVKSSDEDVICIVSEVTDCAASEFYTHLKAQ